MRSPTEGRRKGITAAVAALALLVVLAGTIAPSSARRFVGDAGADRVSGTARADTILLGAGNDRASGGRGNDLMRGGRGNDRLSGGAGRDRLLGDAGRDRLLGGSGNDRVSGGSGNDTVNGGGGRDTVAGGSGSDRVSGGGGNDRAGGGSGSDRVNGGSGSDRAFGGAGNDRVNGGTGNDRVNGDAGNDRVNGDAGNDAVSGGAGNDILNGGPGRDSLSGGAGFDVLTGGAAPDSIRGDAGDDIIDSRDGARDTVVDGGTGRDVCVVDVADVPVVRNCEIVHSGSSAPVTAIAGGGGAPSPTGVGPFVLTFSSGTSCDFLTEECSYILAGTGAKNGSVTATAGQEMISTAGPTPSVNTQGGWIVTGTYRCLSDSSIALSSGGEKITVAIDCVTPAPPIGGGPDNGPLQITSAGITSCSTTQTCTLTLAGTGAEQFVGATGLGSAVVSPQQTTAVNPDGTWAITGQWTCTVPMLPGAFVVGDGGSDVPPENDTVDTTCALPSP